MLADQQKPTYPLTSIVTHLISFKKILAGLQVTLAASGYTP
jgi:hypothetical protein